jgi:hypothetical protein
MGIRSVSIISVKVAPKFAGNPPPRPAGAAVPPRPASGPTWATSPRAANSDESSPGLTALRLSMTISIGLAFFAAIRLSTMKSTRP